MLFQTKKLKSFGITEAIVSSVIVIFVLTSAVTLATSINKTSLNDASYKEAENLAKSLLAKIDAAKSSGSVYFDQRTGAEIKPNTVSIDCFDTAKYSSCSPITTSVYPLSEFPYKSTPIDSLTSRAKPSLADLADTTFGKNFFEFNIAVKKMTEISPAETYCPGYLERTTANISESIPIAKCRLVEVTIYWAERGQNLNYKLSKYITDWER